MTLLLSAVVFLIICCAMYMHIQTWASSLQPIENSTIRAGYGGYRWQPLSHWASESLRTAVQQIQEINQRILYILQEKVCTDSLSIIIVHQQFLWEAACPLFPHPSQKFQSALVWFDLLCGRAVQWKRHELIIWTWEKTVWKGWVFYWFFWGSNIHIANTAFSFISYCSLLKQQFLM